MSFLWKVIRDIPYAEAEGYKVGNEPGGHGIGVENVNLFLGYSKVVVIPFLHVVEGHVQSWRFCSMVLLIGQETSSGDVGISVAATHRILPLNKKDIARYINVRTGIASVHHL